MGIPDEDLGPVWLRDYGSLYNIGGDAAGSGSVRADLPAMDEFASALRDNVDADYVPHARVVFDDMSVPAYGNGFPELAWALEQHRDVKSVAVNNVADHANGTAVFAEAIRGIAQRYRSSDAFAAAQLSDIQQHLGLSPEQPGTNPAGGA